MITKEQLNHIDADGLLYHMRLLETIGSVEQLILGAYSKGADYVLVEVRHEFIDLVEDELEEGGYTYHITKIGTDPHGVDSLQIMLK